MHAMAILLLQIDCAIVEWSVVVQLVTYHLLSTEELQANWVEQLDDKVVLSGQMISYYYVIISYSFYAN
jgi:hypothetical protein